MSLGCCHLVVVVVVVVENIQLRDRTVSNVSWVLYCCNLVVVVVVENIQLWDRNVSFIIAQVVHNRLLRRVCQIFRIWLRNDQDHLLQLCQNLKLSSFKYHQNYTFLSEQTSFYGAGQNSCILVSTKDKHDLVSKTNMIILWQCDKIVTSADWFFPYEVYQLIQLCSFVNCDSRTLCFGGKCGSLLLFYVICKIRTTSKFDSYLFHPGTRHFFSYTQSQNAPEDIKEKSKVFLGMIFNLFLDASTHLYKRVCPSVRR